MALFAPVFVPVNDAPEDTLTAVVAMVPLVVRIPAVTFVVPV
jgi:hypothetical protein